MSITRLRIAHVTATFPPYRGGTGTVCFHNTRVLANRGHDVHVYTALSSGEISDPEGVTVHRLRPVLKFGNAPVMPQLARIPDVDIVHLHFPFYAGGEFVALSHRPFVVTYHQDVELPGWAGRVSRAHDRWIGRRVLRRASRLCPTSMDYFMSSRFSNLISALGSRIEPVPNGVDTHAFTPGGVLSPAIANLRDPQQRPLALFVGSMDSAHYFKGVPTLLAALAQTPGLSALLVGDGDLRSQYELRSRGLGLGDRVRFIGRISDQDLPDVYRAADFLVLPSETRGEAFGVVLLEAMASGKPVIASNLPGVRSVVADGIDGLLVRPSDSVALAEALNRMARMSGEARAAMGRAGRRKVEASYEWSQIGERLEAIYFDVVQQVKAGSR